MKLNKSASKLYNCLACGNKWIAYNRKYGMCPKCNSSRIIYRESGENHGG